MTNLQHQMLRKNVLCTAHNVFRLSFGKLNRLGRAEKRSQVSEFRNLNQHNRKIVSKSRS